MALFLYPPPQPADLSSVAHYSAFIISSPRKPTPSPQRPTILPPKPTPSLLPSSSSSATPHHTATPLKPSSINWKGFLPEQFRKVIQEADQVWIAKCLYEPRGQLKQKSSPAGFTHHWSPNHLLLSLGGTTGRGCSSGHQ